MPVQSSDPEVREHTVESENVLARAVLVARELSKKQQELNRLLDLAIQQNRRTSEG